MFGGYTEVAAYYVNTPWPEAEDEGMEGGEGALPLDYTPRYSPPDPWHRHAACQKDFVMIAEFSEQEGPKPLIVIPKDGGGEFDLNEFSVRIMSVDFQTMAGSSFSTTEDTQLVMSESQNGVYAYVHHFTLYDYQARGFVRPFCMSYVTPDQSKLWAVFEQMSCQFKEVAQCFKHGNLGLFVKDMTHYLSDLLYTKERFHEREETLNDLAEDDRNRNVLDDPEEDMLLRLVTLTGIDNLIKEVKVILESTSNMLNDIGEKCHSQNTPPPQTDVSDTHQEEPPDDTMDVDNFRYSCSLHNHSPNLVKEWDNFRVGSAPQPQCNWTDVKDVYKPRVVRTNKRRFEKSLRGIHDLCMWGAKEGLNQLRSLHKYFSREMYAIQIEQSDVSCMVPHCGLLTVGKTVQLNFLSGLEMTKAALKQKETEDGNFEKKSSSSDTMTSFHSADSFLSCEESSPTRGQHCIQNTFQTPLPFSLENEVESSHNTESTQSTIEDPVSAVAMDAEKWSYDSTVSAAGSCDSISGSLGATSANSERNRLLLASFSPEVSSSMAVVSSADHVTNFGPSSPGYGLQKLMQTSGSLHHVLYSVLCGRPTVVFGTFRMEKDIRSAVLALSMLVPGHTNSSVVVLWHTKPLGIRDLCTHKLLGLSRPEKRKLENMVPGSVKKYITILDLEKKMVWAPEYKGGIISDIYNKRKLLDEQSYIAFIHSALFDLSTRACLYFHNFCLQNETIAIPQDFPDTHQMSSTKRNLYKKAKSQILENLHVTPQDFKIIEYFADIVGSEHTDTSTRSFTDVIDRAVSSSKLEYVSCSWFKA